MDSTNINKMLINIAKGAIYDKLYGANTIDKDDIVKKIPNLAKLAATFVTLTIDGELRGCIGTLVPNKAMLDDILINSQKAAFDDPRFDPLTKEEFEKIEVEISLLSPALEVKYQNFADLKTKIDIGHDGVIIRQGDKRATFLPQVWEQLPTFDQFFTHLFHKAGITDIEEYIEVFVYKVEKISEE